MRKDLIYTFHKNDLEKEVLIGKLKEHP